MYKNSETIIKLGHLKLAYLFFIEIIETFPHFSHQQILSSFQELSNNV